jgi:hypothetical protein
MEEHRLGVFEDWVPRNAFEHKAVDVTGEWIKIYRTIILSVVLYGRENWFLALREVGWGP